SAAVRTNYVNQLYVQETALNVRGSNADTETSGVVINLVPKDGGNRFNGTVAGGGSNGSLQSNNLTDDLIARGVSTPPKVKKIYDIGASLGGPIKRDRLWFYTAHRKWESQQTAPGNYYNETHG